MVQAIIIFVITGAAAAYVVHSIVKSLRRPDCGCGHESECPYARSCHGDGCPHPDGQDVKPHLSS